jgi:hypothetical protein
MLKSIIMSANQQNQPQTTPNREQDTDPNTQRTTQQDQQRRTNEDEETTDDATTEGIPSTEQRP